MFLLSSGCVCVWVCMLGGGCVASRGSAGASTEMVFDLSLSNKQQVTKGARAGRNILSVTCLTQECNFCSIGHLKFPTKMCAGKTFFVTLYHQAAISLLSPVLLQQQVKLSWVGLDHPKRTYLEAGSRGSTSFAKSPDVVGPSCRNYLLLEKVY